MRSVQRVDVSNFGTVLLSKLNRKDRDWLRWYPVLFGKFSDHDECRRLFLPHHCPEVGDGVCHWSLGRYVDASVAAVALHSSTQQHSTLYPSTQSLMTLGDI